MEKLSITMQVNITDEDIDDIMCSALEGGINHWCAKVEVVDDYLGEFASEQISRGGSLRLYDWVSKRWFELTKAKFLRGIKKYLETHPECVVQKENENRKHSNGLIINDYTIDAPLADTVVQYALFGGVAYEK